jgi:predicted Fe-Mo cluster-binding NifX family protein
MSIKKVAFPSTEEGMDKQICGHFGHANMFTVVEFDESTKQIIKSTTVKNPPHQQGGCLTPVMILKNLGVDAIVLTGIGQRPFMGFIQQGIKVYRGMNATISENFEFFLNNRLEQLAGSSCNH